MGLVTLAQSAVKSSKIDLAAVTTPKWKPTYGSAESGSAFTLTASAQDIPGTAISISVTTSSVIFVNLSVTANFNQTAVTLRLLLGSTLIKSLTMQNASASNDIYNTSYSTFVPVSVGTHTIKLQANRGGGGIGNIIGNGASLTAIAFSA